jgi:hypothetical protein
MSEIPLYEVLTLKREPCDFGGEAEAGQRRGARPQGLASGVNC